MSSALPEPDWKWGTPEGSREFDRLVDRTMTFREKLEWLEEAEAFALRLQACRQQTDGSPTAGSERANHKLRSQTPRKAGWDRSNTTASRRGSEAGN